MISDAKHDERMDRIRAAANDVENAHALLGNVLDILRNISTAGHTARGNLEKLDEHIRGKNG